MNGDGLARYPLIVFPQRERRERKNRGGGAPNLIFPTPARQGQRLGPSFRALAERFRATVQDTTQGVDPDLVLVLEIVGTVEEFAQAAARVEGLEWIGEWSADNIPAGDDFRTARDGESVRASVFLLFSNQAALREMLGLWRRYLTKPNERFPRGLARWKRLFSQLYNIRVWDESDRVTPELLADWAMRLEAGEGAVPFETELWYYHQTGKRERAEAEVRRVVEESGGRVLSRALIDEIEYHALLGVIPAAAVEGMRNRGVVRLFRSRDIMFVRPVAQAYIPSPAPDEEVVAAARERPLPDPLVTPIVALLDGMPMENHAMLDGRIVVDDPDGWAAEISVADRRHGTAMASLIIHGDLSANEGALNRPVYVRPILKPEGPNWHGLHREAVPEDVLFVDIVHRAVRRLFEEAPAEAGRIYVINLSIGDHSRIFDRVMSPCARLLDWLSWTYQVLFLVSAGNQGADLELQIPRYSLTTCKPADLEAELLRSIDRDGINRRLLSPAESINCLTVGALYQDSSVGGQIPNAVEAYAAPLPSPYNAQGFGYRRGVKPDVLFPGGRLLVRERLATGGPNAVAEMLGQVTRRPGQCAAAPPFGNVLGPNVTYSRGTSNACAIATRTAAQIFDVLRDANSIDLPIPDEFLPVALKTAIVHGASWGSLSAHYEAAIQFGAGVNPRDYIAKYLGNGSGDLDRSSSCTARRVTVLGFGALPDGSADVFDFPLPPGLSAQAAERVLTVTLAWISPINVRHRNYRRAHLWYSFPEANAAPELLVPAGRVQVHGLASLRGTVQHEVFEGHDSRVYRSSASIRIWVNCRADAGVLEDAVPYCIAVSLEVPESVNIPIYQQVSNRIRQLVTVETR